MAKYIDADALLTQMKDRRFYVGRRSDPICIIEDAPSAEVEPKRKWISVAERVPEKYGTYLVYTARGAFMVGCYYPQAKNWNVRATVTHWMPLPGKPKGEQVDE